MFHTDIKKIAKENINFRKVVCTGRHSQVVLMTLRPGEDIGEEVHDTIDQIFSFIGGTGEAVIEHIPQPVKEHDLVFVPAGTLHNIKNTGRESLKLYTIYSPPAHRDGTIHRTKADALKAEPGYEKQPVPA